MTAPPRSTAPRIILSTLLVLGLAACKDDNKSSGNASSSKEGGCKEYIQASKNYCIEAMDRGLNLSCMTAILGIHTAMDQADGNLFQVGDKATHAGVADSACRTYHKMLGDAYAKANPPSNVQATFPEECSKLKALVTTGCIEPLGAKKVPDHCYMYISAVANGHNADRQGGGAICESYTDLLQGEL